MKKTFFFSLAILTIASCNKMDLTPDRAANQLSSDARALTPLTNFTNLVKELGKYFGPLSSNPTNTVYTAAIYDGAQAGFAIGQSTSVAQYLNFVEDMGYFENNTTRFNRWAGSIGNAKTMIGVSRQYNSLSTAKTAAAWEPSGAKKAGIMVFAGNVDSVYTNGIFRAVL